jgi:hypothetical protein
VTMTRERSDLYRPASTRLFETGCHPFACSWEAVSARSRNWARTAEDFKSSETVVRL